MPLDNLPGIWKDEQDGVFLINPINDNPIALVLGTASQGDSEEVTRVARTSDAASTFGTTGTLIRGMFEANKAGAKNVRLFRIGATSATLSTIAGSTLELETLAKDDSSGTDYELFFEDSTGRLRVYRASDDTLVYDNNPAYPLDTTDLGEVVVSGSATGSGGDVGSLGTPLTMAAADGVNGSSYTAGTDGINLSRMELYEALYNAYDILGDQEADIVVPMNVFLDDLNCMDVAAGNALLTSRANTNAYPTASDTDDGLGKVFVQEYQGVNYFWWWFPQDPSATASTQFTTDAGADIFPSGATATTDMNGDAITGADFHEVNFAYQLANFCYIQSRDNTDMTGVVGVLPPDSFGPRDVSIWVGQLPTTELDSSNNVVVEATGNGTGLLGNKFMSGRITASGIPGHSVNGVDGLYNGGFIATETGWLDGTEVSDDNDHLVDIGKYISVIATYPILSNSSQSSAYSTSGAPTYGGFYSTLPATSAPTNKLLKGVRLPFRLSTAKLDSLAGQRYVTFHAKTRGIVVSDAPVAARPDSDYQRLSTVLQVKAAMDAVRAAGEPFLGEGMSGAVLAALDTAIDSQLKALVKQGILNRYEHSLTSTATQRVLGQATVELVLVPAFELRQITVVVSLAAV